MDAAVKPLWMGLRRSSKGPPQPKNHAKNIKYGNCCQNRVVAEYALRDSNKPIGVAEYQLVEALPPELKTSLSSIEQIEQELGDFS